MQHVDNTAMTRIMQPADSGITQISHKTSLSVNLFAWKSKDTLYYPRMFSLKERVNMFMIRVFEIRIVYFTGSVGSIFFHIFFNK